MKIFYYINIVFIGLILPASSFAQTKSEKKSTDTIPETRLIEIPFGKQSKESVTGAISSVNSGTIRRNGVTSVTQALPGTLPGLITVLGGGNGIAANNYTLLIRGKATDGTTAPLVLVDNIERSMEYIDPDEIESVTILKDASTQVMYGLRGANGVILITTKRGSIRKSEINVDVRAGVQSSEFWAPKLNAYQYATIYNEGLTNDGRLPTFSQEDLRKYRTGSDPYLFPDVDYRKELLKSLAPIQNYNFSARGGDKTIRYYSALGYLNQGGFFKFADQNSKFNTQNKFERFNFRTNLDATVADGLDVGLDVNAIISNNHSPWTLPNTILANLNNTPANSYPLFNGDGSLGGNTLFQNNAYGQIANSGYRDQQTRSLQAVLRVSKTLDFVTQGLSLNASYSIDNFNPFVTGQSRTFAVFQVQPNTESYTQFGTNSQLKSEGSSSSDYFRRNVLNASFNYSRTFNENHSLNGIFLYNQSRLNVSGDNPDWKYQSFASRFSYGYKQKYFAEVAASYSGVSNFSPGSRMGFFPAVSAAWIASNENFFNVKAINLLKLRASAGEVGNDLISGGRYQYKQTSTAGGGYGFGIPNGISLGSTEGILGNEAISWEKAFKTNIGVDLQLFNKSIEFTADYFHERRRDIAIAQSVSVPGIIGIGLPNENGGIVLNRGFDFNLQYNFKLNDLNLFAGLNGVFAKNKIVNLGEQVQQYAYQYRKGHSLDARFGLVADGLYQNVNEINNGPSSSFSQLLPGDIRYVNQNPGDDNVIDTKDRVIIGKGPVPEFYYGLNLGGSFKSFDFSMLFQGAAERDVMYISSQYSTEYYLNRWTPATAETATFPRITSTTSGHNNMQTSTFWQRNGSYLRFKNIELGYTFKNVLNMQSVRLYVNGMNLTTFSGFDNQDPEDLRLSYTLAPLARTYTFGINVKM